MNNFLERLRQRLWQQTSAITRTERYLVNIGRHIFALARDLLEGQISMRAMSLVYTSLLSLVPILALAFSVLKAFGAHNTLEPLLYEFLRPLGGQADEIVANIMGFVDKMKVGVLGSLGISLLLYSAVSLIQKVESSFNYIWRISRPRPVSQRISDYLSVLMIGPVLVFSALGLTATISSNSIVEKIISIEPFGLLFYSLTQLLPYLLIVAAFSFLYSFIPNTRVRWRAALGGGLFAGIAWQTSSVLFASFVTGATNYNAIYSGFAIFIFLLLWLHVGWLILLLGCQLSYYLQHPSQLSPDRVAPALSGRGAEYLTLMIMALSGRRFINGEAGYTQEELARALNAPPEHVAQTVETLLRQGLLIESGRKRTQLHPGMDLDTIRLTRLWRLARAGNSSIPHNTEAHAVAVTQLLDEAESRFEKAHQDLSLRAFILHPDRDA
ncbi:YihY/virulence factor BrkB family protein [Stenotrophobium rhamnosiphilum]|uniref:Ribonuclease BN n=1 Tax=Stenotrophobium rhamnosiphilum TaxID=2029166 RepID=A0A2T5MJ46_9GAMM|nr:YihY/virulence factor BrkB family protein [Stenotrophobium rhamnosiphilum]PTU32603.1 ribonuclease BN [Stenotrophobium rhamnosiphilum]